MDFGEIAAGTQKPLRQVTSIHRNPSTTSFSPHCRRPLTAIYRERKSCNVLQKLSPGVQWVQSHVTDDRMYCLYIAVNEESVREHARQSGFPASRISEVRAVIDPTTGGA